jgi:polyisoprenoid-binding protein YceI
MTDSVAATREFEGLQIPAAGTYLLDAAHKRVGFVVRHLMVSKVRGNFGEATATITVGEDPLQSSVTASITTASVFTGQPDRDNHLRTGDFFEAEKYPTIEFESTGIKSHDGNEFLLDGNLTIKGVTKPVELEVEFLGIGQDPWGGQRLGFEATTVISRKDWGVDFNIPLDGGKVLIGDKVNIHLAVEAVRDQA